MSRRAGARPRLLRTGDVRFHPHSYADPEGRLFEWDGGLYRALRGERADFFARLLDEGVLKALSDAGLMVETERAPIGLEGYGLVLRHDRIPYPSYPTEWCSAMFAAAARSYLDLLDALRERGLGLKDVHPWNLLFDATRPVFVDLTSIVPAHEASPASLEEKYRRYYLLPLRLMAGGRGSLARCLLQEYDGIKASDVAALEGVGSRPGRVRARLRRTFPPDDAEQATRRLRAELRPYLAPDAAEAAAVPLDEAAAAALGAIDRVGPESVLILGPDQELACRVARDRPVVAIDSDESRSAALYARARAERLPLLPLLMDFRKPTPSIGYSGHFSIAASDRLACELVVAADLVPRLAGQPFLTFDHIGEGLSLFATRWALVGFGPPRPADPGRTPPPWYGEQELLDALRARFRSVEPFSEEPRLFLCER